MTEPITAGALVLTVSIAALFAAVRAWPGPGRHRATTTPAPAERVRLADWPEPVYGAAVPQAFRHCRGCRGEASVVLHPGAHTCDAGHVTITTIGGNR